MAVAAVMGAMSAGTAALTGAALFGGSFLTHFLITTAMGAALNALSPKPSSGSRGYSITGETGSALDHQIIYGRMKVGGVRIYDASTGANNEYLHRVLVFAGHRVESFDEIYLNDELLTLDGSGNVTSPSKYNGYVRIKTKNGTNAQAADSDLVDETSSLAEGAWTNTCTLSGIAYMYVRIKFSSNVFPNGVPSFSAVIKGKRILDPRTSTTAWTDNPALCIRDYLTSSYGLDLSTAKVPTASVITAADICDQTVTTATGTEKRYTCNGVFTTGQTPKQILSDLITSMGGLLWYSGGVWKMKAAAYTTPTITLTDSDLRSSVSVSTRFSRRDNFNTVKGTFRGAETSWQETDYPSVTDPAFLTADNNLENAVDLTLPFTSSSFTAQRLAKIFLFRNREQITVSASWGLNAFKVEVGDIVYLTLDRFGWVSKAFEVTSWTFGLTDNLDVQANLTLREISSEVFDDVSGVVFELNNTNLPSAYYVPAIGVAMSDEMKVINEHATNVLYADVTSLDPTAVEKVEVQFKKDTETNWKVLGSGDLGRFEIQDVAEVIYNIRVRAYSYLGIKGDWYTVSYQPSGSSAPPADVTNFGANLTGSTISLSWDASPDLDLSYYKIRHSVDETGAAWGDAVTYVEKVSRPATTVSVPAKPGTYMIKAIDKSGHASENAVSVVVPAAALESFTTTLTSQQDPTFGGTKSGCSVVSSALRITDVSGTPPFTATYTYNASGVIDTGAVRRFRARVDLDLTRVDTSAGLWDNISGNFDSLPGLFDTFTGGGQYDDVNVITYISTTPDDPSGTPTWSAWQEFKSGDFYARAARFRVILSSQSQGITPSITALKGIVQYN